MHAFQSTAAHATELRVPFWGTRAELADVIALARAGRIRAHVEWFAWSDVHHAYETLRAARLDRRAVVMPSGQAR